MAKKRKHAAGARWVIEGFDSIKPLERFVLPKSSWVEPRIIDLLKRLVSKHLSVDDVVNASRAPRDQFYNPVLKETRSTSGKRLTISVGANPHYIANLC